MPFNIHILEEDLAGWELTHRGRMVAPEGGWSYHYRPRLPDDQAELIDQIQLIAPAPLKDLVERNMDCFVNIEKGWLREKTGAHPEVKFKLKYQPEKGERKDPRRLRLRIKSIDTKTRPPRVILESLGPEEFKR